MKEVNFCHSDSFHNDYENWQQARDKKLVSQHFKSTADNQGFICEPRVSDNGQTIACEMGC